MMSKLGIRPDSLNARDFPINQKRIDRFIQENHKKGILFTNAAGKNKKFVLLNFYGREQPDKQTSLSIICDRNGVTKPYLVIVRNPKDGISHCSLRDYHPNGELRFYGYLTQEDTKQLSATALNLLTGLHHTKLGSEAFEFRVPRGWS